MTASFKPSKDQSRVLVNGNRHDRLEPIHYPYRFKAPFTVDWVVTDADYPPVNYVPRGTKLELV